MAIYNGKHVVFEQVGVDSDQALFNAFTNVDSDNCYNNWDISGMRNTTLPAVLLKLSSDLQTIITSTTIQTAKNGLSSTLVSTSDKLFIAAEKEQLTYNNYSVSAEFNALFTWTYWVNHTTASDHKKYDSSATARRYAYRSPDQDENDRMCFCKDDGYTNSRSANDWYYVYSCFAI